MKTLLLAASAVAALAAGSANAAVTFYSFGGSAPVLPLVTDFSGDTTGSAPTTTASGYSWSSGTGVVLDNTTGSGAEPAVANGVYGTGNYLSILGGASETLSVTKPGINTIELYIGSLDTYNTLFFAGPNVTYTGADLGLLSGAANGAQTASNTNGVFEFTFSAPVTGVTFSSSSNSLEIASISAGVPEPGVWAMMLVGFGGMGAMMRRRRAVAAAA
jgi:hypothetical protein